MPTATAVVSTSIRGWSACGRAHRLLLACCHRLLLACCRACTVIEDANRMLLCNLDFGVGPVCMTQWPHEDSNAQTDLHSRAHAWGSKVDFNKLNKLNNAL
jgi:hypothetical protein